MAGELFTYMGQARPGRFRWERAYPADEAPGKSTQMFLVPVSPGIQAEATYDLHDLDVVLFRVFGATAPTAKGVLTFAAHYGCLGIDVPIRPAAGKTGGPTPESRGEPLIEWQKEISLMAQLIGVWDLHRAGDAARLSRHIRWESDGQGGSRAAFYSHVKAEEGEEGGPLALGNLKTHEVIATENRPFEPEASMTPREVLFFALSHLQRRLDAQLRRHERRAAPSMALQPSRDRLSLRFAASSLVSALWLQLADAVVNERTYGRCKECGEWFEVAPEAARSHRRFCSDACRSKAYRLRQDRARQMHFEGGGFEEIAEELGCTADAVRRWVTGMRS